MAKISQKILMVDSDRMSLNSLSTFLNSEGISVIPCATREDAFASMDSNEYEFLLVNLSVQDKTDLDFILEVKELSPNIETILYSGFINAQYLDKALKLVDHYFMKPLRIHELLQIFQSKNKNMEIK